MLVVKRSDVYSFGRHRAALSVTAGAAALLLVSSCGSKRFRGLDDSGGPSPMEPDASVPSSVEAGIATSPLELPTQTTGVEDAAASHPEVDSRADSGTPSKDHVDTSPGEAATSSATSSAFVTSRPGTEFADPGSPAPDAGFTDSTPPAVSASDASVSNSHPDASNGSDGSSQGDATGPTDPNACNSGEFGEPRLVLGLGFDDRLWGPAISSDGNVLLFGYTANDENLYVATMVEGETRTFENVTALTSLNTSGGEGTPFLSYDGLTLYFYATREGGPGDRDLWFATRPGVRDDFGEPEQVPGVNGELYDHLPWVSDDELTIFYTTERDGGLGKSDLWTAKRPSKQEPFGDHALVSGINSEDREDAIAFSPDRLTVYFTTDRETDGNLDIWRATRASRNAAFSNPEVVPELNSDSEDTNLAMSRDGKQLYFSSGRNGKQRLWVASRACD